jgi:hypothetical protein
MKKNLTKIVMLVLTICMMIAVFAVVASAEEAADLKNATVTLDKYYTFFDGEVHNPVVTVKMGDTVLKEGVDYTVAWRFYDAIEDYTTNHKNTGAPAEGEAWGNKVSTLQKAGAYNLVLIGKGDYAGTSKAAGKNDNGMRFHILGDTKYNSDLIVTPGTWVYGNEDNAAQITIASAYKTHFTRLVEYSVKGENNFTSVVPTIPGEYQVRVTDIKCNFYAMKTVDFKIEKRKVELNILENEREYGDSNDGLYKFEYAEGSLKFLAADIDNIVMTPGYEGDENVGPQYSALTAKVEHPYYDVTVNAGDLFIKQRVVDFKDNYVLQYNGKVQLPTVEILNLVGDDECSVEVIGSSRKYGGTYNIKIVAIGNDNYTLGDNVTEVILTYTIVADGVADRDTAVGEFVDGVINAGETLGEVVEVVAPVVGNIGKFIFGGIKAGVSALVNDFFGRVFG